MYQITTGNGVLGYAETVSYCYKLPSGSPLVLKPRNYDKATGVIYRGVVYNLPGHNDFEGAETASAAEIDAGAVLNHMAEQLSAREAAEADTDAMTVDHELRLVMLELGLNE